MRARSGLSKNLLMTAVTLVVAMVASSCLYFPVAKRHIRASGGTDVPWWCEGTPDLTPDECTAFSAQTDFALAYAQQFPALADFTATGAVEFTNAPAGVGVAYGATTTTFVPTRPNILLYDGTAPTSRLVGFAWAIEGAEAPTGFEGARDVWTPVDPPEAAGSLPIDSVWWLSAWMVRGYLHHPDVFALSHPCLESEVPLTSTSDACFLASHTEPLQILVTNDDGVGAPGIDAMVEALLGVSGVEIEIVAPAVNQSGSGDNYTPGGTTSAPATTASGRAAIAVDGTPADSVLHAIYALGLNPDLVMSGINEGQNLANIGDLLSGTVGAARTGARSYVPAVASSQGTVLGLEPDFDSGADAVLAWLERFRLGTAGPPFMTVANINIPTCAPGSSIRGTVETVVAPSIGPGQSYFTQDCTSTETNINDDLDAFNHGFIGIADMGLGS